MSEQAQPTTDDPAEHETTPQKSKKPRRGARRRAR